MILFGVIAIIPRNSLGMILALFSFGVALFMVIVLLSHYIEITHEQISGRIALRKFSFFWSEILAISVSPVEGSEKFFLGIGVGNEIYFQSLEHFDTTKISETIKKLAHPEALALDAFENLPGRQERIFREKEELLSATIEVGVNWVFKGLGWLAISISIILGIASVTQQNMANAIYCSPGIGVMGLLLMVLCSTKVLANSNGIIMRTPLQKLGIRWEEIKQIQYNGLGTMAFLGENKRLIISGQNLDKNREQLSAKIGVHAKKFDVEIKLAQRIPFTQKNVRLKRGENF